MYRQKLLKEAIIPMCLAKVWSLNRSRGFKMATEIKMTRPLARPSVERPRFLTVEELAEMLRVEVRTVYSWVSKGSVPFRKAGRRTVFLLDEILEWTEQQSLR
jgi:excisionase family DNA binding protein